MDELARWNQLKEIQAIQHGLASLRSCSPPRWPEGQEEPLAVAEWAPLVDISEDDKEYLIKAELPGVDKEHVKVTAEEGAVTITGNANSRRRKKAGSTTASNGPTAVLCATSRSPMMPAPRRSAPSSRTVCSPCIWPKQRSPGRSKLRSRLPERAEGDGRSRPPLTPERLLALAASDALRPPQPHARA